MEVITLSGYVAEEKVAIAMKYLGPAAREASGLKKEQVDLQEEAVELLIRNYCRESGVRNLKKHIDKVYRKAAFRVVSRSQESEEKQKAEGVVVEEANKDETKDEPLKISEENLRDYVGSPKYTSDRMYDVTPPDSKPSFHRTGQLGDVMKESSTIAYTFSKAFMARHFPDIKFFDKAGVHLHVPEGATPKDAGPSAGVTMTTSLLSLALNTPALADVAMTGELTLTGKVLKIGGVKEKTIAAKRSGIKNILFPAANRADWDELPDYIKDGLTPHFVGWYDEVFKVVFPGLELGAKI
ncbi:Lon protease C-terminal proteolytic domain-containing protein [Chytriomyces sp. MP71]|nr:Lon protease C-terminal proteolytic domain-containing protein [Chytriomyces sp. MP71]